MRITSSYNLFEETLLLFSGMSAVSAILLIAGLLLCIIEISRPALGIFIGTGVALLAIGIVVRMSDNGSLQMLFILFFIISFIITAAYIISMRVNKYRWILRGISAEGISYNTEEETTDSKEYYFLLNHEGITATELNPSGIIVINDIEFDAISQSGEEIAEDTPVRVVEVENEKIIVKPV